ncbi:MAG: J domain-containing protein [Planctomycetes bacterium]|nr:J domain-containing protein [Planctomycetota bacterium]
MTQRLVAADKRARRILGVGPAASHAEIKAAYWLLAMENHPDRCPGDETAAERFRVATAAYEFLLGRTVDDSLLRYHRESKDTDPARSGKYHTDSTWGHFLWWRDKFF